MIAGYLQIIVLLTPHILISSISDILAFTVISTSINTTMAVPVMLVGLLLLIKAISTPVVGMFLTVIHILSFCTAEMEDLLTGTQVGDGFLLEFFCMSGNCTFLFEKCF